VETLIKHDTRLQEEDKTVTLVTWKTVELLQ